MGTELVRTSPVSVPAARYNVTLPALIERAGAAARFAWDEFFFAEHHNPHTQRAYQSAVRRFLAWADGQGMELASIAPGMVGQYLTALGGSAAKRNLHLSALRGFFDRMVQRHVVLLNPAASVRGRQTPTVHLALTAEGRQTPTVHLALTGKWPRRCGQRGWDARSFAPAYGLALGPATWAKNFSLRTLDNPEVCAILSTAVDTNTTLVSRNCSQGAAHACLRPP